MVSAGALFLVYPTCQGLAGSPAGSIVPAKRCCAVELNSKQTLGKHREGHAVIMVVGILISLLLAGAAIIPFEYLPLFEEIAPADTPKKPDTRA